jgi:septal ring factor EnvC (AmiA/AmiB activator)
MIVLILALAGTACSAWLLGGRLSDISRENEARVLAAQSELDAQKAAYAAIDPSTDEGMARQIEAEQQAVAEAQQQTEELQKDNEALLRENNSLSAQIRELEADEENAYYLAVYESLHKGMEMVEGYLDGE